MALTPSVRGAMADRTAALRGGAPDQAQPGASGRLTTPAWLDQRDSRPDASKARGTTVKRYWPGQAPSFGDQQGDLSEERRPVGGAGPADPTGWSGGGSGHQALLSEAQPHREIKPPQVVALPRREAAPQHQAPPEEEEEEDEEEVLRRRAAARSARSPRGRPGSPPDGSSAGPPLPPWSCSPPSSWDETSSEGTSWPRW